MQTLDYEFVSYLDLTLFSGEALDSSCSVFFLYFAIKCNGVVPSSALASMSIKFQVLRYYIFNRSTANKEKKESFCGCLCKLKKTKKVWKQQKYLNLPPSPSKNDNLRTPKSLADSTNRQGVKNIVLQNLQYIVYLWNTHLHHYQSKSSSPHDDYIWQHDVEESASSRLLNSLFSYASVDLESDQEAFQAGWHHQNVIPDQGKTVFDFDQKSSF